MRTLKTIWWVFYAYCAMLALAWVAVVTRRQDPAADTSHWDSLPPEDRQYLAWWKGDHR